MSQLPFKGILLVFVVLMMTCGAEASHVVSVKDAIEATVISDSEYMDINLGESILLSPDQQHFAVVTRRGDLESNKNEYRLLWFNTEDVLKGSSEQRFVVHASGTNTPGISQVKWLDSGTLLFLGADKGDVAQLFSLNVSTGLESQLTHHMTDVLAYDATADLATIAYFARPPMRSLSAESANGMVIENQVFSNALLLQTSDGSRVNDHGLIYPYQMFLLREQQLRHVDLPGNEFPSIDEPIFLAPNGANVIIGLETHSTNPRWRRYPESKDLPFVNLHRIVDTSTGATRLLIDAPAVFDYQGAGSIRWLSAESVLVMSTYLPNSNEALYIVELNIQDGHINVITSRPRKRSYGHGFRLKSWNSTEKLLTIFPAGQSAGNHSARPETYYRGEGGWEKVSRSIVSAGAPFELLKEEDMNSPTRIIVHERSTGRRAAALDLAEQFQDLRLSSVQEISWTSDGHSFKGGLFLPADYVPGKRYPLVIQTHGWNAKQFAMDGLESGAGYAARVLAGKGIIVVQIDENWNRYDSIYEARSNTRMFDDLIERLNRKGLIDIDRIGLLGWSRTVYHVRYALSFSRYKIAAAVISDGMDASLSSFIEWADQGKWAVNYLSRVNGGDPLKGYVQRWVQNDLTFQQRNVTTPVKIFAFGNYTLQTMWHPYSELKYLQKPVEYVWLPFAVHSPVRPLERQTVEGGTVDWFCFWLKDEEDPDPSKVEQYIKWKAMRKHQHHTTCRTPITAVSPPA